MLTLCWSDSICRSMSMQQFGHVFEGSDIVLTDFMRTTTGFGICVTSSVDGGNLRVTFLNAFSLASVSARAFT